MSRRTWAVVAVLSLLVACGSGEAPDDREIVAVVDGRQVTRDAVTAHLDRILTAVPDESPEVSASAELDRLRSRLLDGYLDEIVLLIEADRRNVVIEDDDIRAYLGTEAEAADAYARERAERRLRIQALRALVAGEEGDVTDEEVLDRVERRSDELLPLDSVFVRAVLLPNREAARRLKGEVARGEVTLEHAAAIFGPSPGDGHPVELPLEHIPPVVREVLEPLEIGEVSEPVDYQGKTYLFSLIAWPVRGLVEPGFLERRAREQLRRERAQASGSRLLEGLRETMGIEIRQENLPFRYLPADEGPPPDGESTMGTSRNVKPEGS